MRKHILWSMVAAALLVSFPGKGFGEGFLLGVKGGVLFPGTMTISVEDVTEFDVDTEMGWMVGVKGDGMVAERFSMGFFLQRIGVKAKDMEGEAAVTTIGGTLKGHFGQPDGVKFRPGLAIGYQMVSHEEFSEDTQGLDMGAVLEVAIPTSKAGAVDIELGFISQPVGGNDDFDLTFAPILYLNVGYEFVL